MDLIFAKLVTIYCLLVIQNDRVFGCHGYNGLHHSGKSGKHKIRMRFLQLVENWTIFHKCLHKIKLTMLEDLIIKYDLQLHQVLHEKWRNIDHFLRAVEGTASCEYMTKVCKSFQNCYKGNWDKKRRRFKELSDKDVESLESSQSTRKGAEVLKDFSSYGFEYLLEKFQADIELSKSPKSESVKKHSSKQSSKWSHTTKSGSRTQTPRSP